MIGHRDFCLGQKALCDPFGVFLHSVVLVVERGVSGPGCWSHAAPASGHPGCVTWTATPQGSGRGSVEALP